MDCDAYQEKQAYLKWGQVDHLRLTWDDAHAKLMILSMLLAACSLLFALASTGFDCPPFPQALPTRNLGML